MKLDRLYGITIYLLNHGKTSSNELAKHFEVSTRTIQRDIEALCQSGIPVVALTGTTGGYEIIDTFHMDQHAATQEDYSHILTALRGLATAMNNPKINATVEKISALRKEENKSVILDFSVLREGDEKVLQQLQTAVLSKRVVSFIYTNTDNVTRTHQVEPIAVLYRWYSWYLLAYSTFKEDYRKYKLARISDLLVTDIPFSKEHESAEQILHANDEVDTRTYCNVSVRCKPEVRNRVIEYLRGVVKEELSGGDVLMTLQVVPNEHFWLGMLLSLGDSVEILQPEEIRLRVQEAAKNIVALYEKR